MNLDDDLRRAFRRTAAPRDFVDRVLASLEQRDAPAAAPAAWPLRTALQWLAAAAVITVVTAGGARYYIQQQTVAEAERVQKEVRVALDIAGEKLALVQRKLQDSER
jgi:hypothetical protein